MVTRTVGTNTFLNVNSLSLIAFIAMKRTRKQHMESITYILMNVTALKKPGESPNSIRVKKSVKKLFLPAISAICHRSIRHIR